MSKRFLLIASLSSLFLVPMVTAGPDRTGWVCEELNREPKWNEKPCSPADGAVVKVNPPAFVWLPLKKCSEHYTLALSRSTTFPTEETILHKDVARSVFIPTEPLAPGRWHWRVGVALDEGRTAWSVVRGFTVPDDVKQWPFPKMNDLVAKVPKEHPRLFFPGEELERVRTVAPRKMGPEYRGVLRRAEKWIGEPLVKEPDYLRKKGTERGAEYAAIFRATRPPMDKMEASALAYLLSGEKRFGEEAKRRVLHFFSWDPEGPTSLFHNDEPAMWMMQRGIRAYDWTYDLFSPEERARIEPAMKARCEQFLKRLRGMPFESRPYSSHPARDVGFLGEAALCFIHEWPEARGWLEYVLSIYRSTFPAWGEDDGGWQEGPSYWRAYMGFALHFAAALEKATGESIVEKPFFQNTPYYKLYTNPPYAKLSPFGDAQHHSPGKSAGQLMYAFASLLNDPYIRWYSETQRAGTGTGPMGFALFAPDLDAKPSVDLPQARVFDGAGLVAMHARLADPGNNAYLVLRSSPMGSVSHGHADQNAFAIEAFGEALAIASGYYPWYGSPHHHDWTRETKAVNSVTVNGGQGQRKRCAGARGRIARFLAGEAYDYALGDAARAYYGRLKRFDRHVIHVRPGTFVLVDELQAPEPVIFEWWLHALEKMELNQDRGEVVLGRRAARLRAKFVAPRDIEFFQTDRFSPPPENGSPNQWHFTASTMDQAASARFIVVMSPYREGETPPEVKRLEKDDVVGATWSEEGVEHTILSSPGGIDVQDVRTDGRLVAVRREAGKWTGWTLVEAKQLALDGQIVFQAEEPTTATWASDDAGGRLVLDGPSVDVAVRLSGEPVVARRHGAKQQAVFWEGLVRLAVPEGRETIDFFLQPPDETPQLTVLEDGKKKTLLGKRFNRVEALWQDRHAGPDGEHQLALPEGIQLIVDTAPVVSGRVELRKGQNLWWHGRPTNKPVTLQLKTLKGNHHVSP